MYNFLIVNLLVIVAFFEWSPNPDEFYVVFVLAGLWGVSDAIWQTQINGKHTTKQLIKPFIFFSLHSNVTYMKK